MIITFGITNFRSFKEKTEFNMIAGNYKRFPKHVYSKYIPNLLRSSAIYGNNAAGKSNLIIALETLKSIVTGCIEITTAKPLPYFKLDQQSINTPTVFEVDYVINNKRYSYLISFVKDKIVEEWLYRVVDNNTNKLETIFERNLVNGKTKLKIGNQKKVNQKEQLRAEIYAEELDNLKTTSFLYYGHEKKIASFEEPYEWFNVYLQIVRPNYIYPKIIQDFDQDKAFTSLAKQILKALNLGIKNIKVERIPIDDFFGVGEENKKREIIDKLTSNQNLGVFIERGGLKYSIYKNERDEFIVARLVSVHDGISQDIQFEMDEESTGTQKIIEILPAIILAITRGFVFVYDEIESSIHPCIIREILKLYLDAGNENTGQLIFSTHECNLLDLDLFRQDEIWFAEKDLNGSSHIYSLSDFKPRYDKDVRKGFLEGLFTTIPFFTEPEKLNWNEK